MNNPNEDVELSVAEGVLLGHALVARVAAELGIRAFFIKGPASVLQGLRKPKTSGDVDVFVSPQDLEMIVGALQTRGWRKRPIGPDSSVFPRHSVTLSHSDWPCCLDIHYRYPGMETPNAECFELMWMRTDSVKLAGQVTRVPSIALGVLILSLHALRTPQLISCQEELEFLARVTKERVLAAEILDLAAGTGSLAAIRPFLEALVPQFAASKWPEPSAEWRNRLIAKEPGSGLLITFIRSPWSGKPRALWRGAFPGTAVLLSRDLYADMSRRGRIRQHAARWKRFLKSVPNIVRDLGRLDS
ncbi:nucleotidyltransferase family protein [Arthrobacter sp. Leaf137]|uniref:nucleotidyltransferase family protein n=1 Tax=Arthrobacter sp. Leaf137 TaxID=1736271 RepID=UPI0009EB8A17|nr:nucleotidyltransferase family protein [Arthrobacter sp. Leaf137]